MTAAVFLWNLFWVVPADLSAEGDAVRTQLQNKLDSFVATDPDATLEEAVGYVLTGAWTASFPGDRTQVGEAFTRFRRAAHRQRIGIWGQLSAFSLPILIDHEFWEHHAIDLAGFFEPDTPARTEKCRTATPTYRYLHLQVVRRQVEREWQTTAPV